MTAHCCSAPSGAEGEVLGSFPAELLGQMHSGWAGRDGKAAGARGGAAGKQLTNMIQG